MSSSRASKTREAILDAARALFEEHGYFAVGLEAVASKAGISRQAIYLHFASKADLLRALHERVNATRRRARRSKRSGRPKRPTTHSMRGSTRPPRQFPSSSASRTRSTPPRRSDPDVEATWQAPAERHYADCLRLADTPETGEEAAVPRMTVADAADILWAQTSIWAFESLVVDRGWPVARWVRWQRRALRELLFADTAKPE